ncbi:MAG: selenobiotic family peptide radical SAM maturase [Nitrospirota bacterium]|nr:MAG: selenobiotic family peptide radical SAM maturase [Nitrospirota bacterium]
MSKKNERNGLINVLEVFPRTASMLNDIVNEEIINKFGIDLERFPDEVENIKESYSLKDYIGDVARIEYARFKAKNTEESIEEPENRTVNPSFQLLQVSWQNLISIFNGDDKGKGNGNDIISGDQLIMVWKDKDEDEVRMEYASSDDLLALKIVVEGIGPEDLVSDTDLTIGKIDNVIRSSIEKGILIAPPSSLVRDPDIFKEIKDTGEEFLVADTFTLQWHITQSCDLHCKHCYDRSDRTNTDLADAIRILDDMRSFCLERNVKGHISFSGGNPLMHPDFLDIYNAASDRGFSLAILGNVASRKQLKDIIAIQMPGFYQVSLEGLEGHNDSIRGEGYFRRVMDFLTVLKELGIYSMVMLTLTNENIDQVIPLAELLKGKVDSFTFNRLSLVGEGASLKMADNEKFRKFLEDYIELAGKNKHVRLKDNFINIIRREKGQNPFGGCAGYGCSAAFNFITVLPDGEVHACRKFPSKIGRIMDVSLSELYDSEMAKKYRSGPEECRGCDIRAVCGGCMAVAYGCGKDVFKEKDPFCFMRLV